MNTKLLLTTLALGMASLPVLASAQISVNLSATTSISATTGIVTEAQLLTACSQTSIEIRDSAISSARTAYNNSMSVALDARKEAEKKAVALTDAGEKKDAIKIAVENYKKDVTQAQETLTKARKEAWAQFETNTNACRDMSKDKKEGFVTEKKTITDTKKSELRAVHIESKTEIQADERKAETKSLRETFKEQLDVLRAFFKIGASGDTHGTAN